MQKVLVILLFLLSAAKAGAQMWNGTDTLYGNEWIDFSQQYFKIKVAADGLYRIPQTVLVNAAIPVGAIPAGQYRLYRNGSQIPVYLSTDGLLGEQDYIEFYGEKNRGEADRFLFNDPTREQLNPRYSMFNDTAVYYLSWTTTGVPERVTDVPNTLSNLPVKESWCWFAREDLRFAHFFKKETDIDVKYSWYDGNGFGKTGSNESFSVSLEQAYTGGPDASLQLRFACNLGPHHKLLSLNDVPLGDWNFYNYRLVDTTFALDPALTGAPIVFKMVNENGSQDAHNMPYLRWRYPRLFNFGSDKTAGFELEPVAADPYLEIPAFNTAADPVVYDRGNAWRLTGFMDNGVLKIHLPAATGVRNIYIAAPESIREITQVSPVQFRDFRQENADYILISNPALYSDPLDNGANHVQAYADYRSSPAGGSYQVAVVDVNQLYEQFGYGVRFSPLAIRNFCHFIKKHWTNAGHVLIVGKGIDIEYFRTTADQQLQENKTFFVPMYSSPGSDLPFVLAPNSVRDPVMAIGRLPVTRPAEIRAYLDKVIAQETPSEQTIAAKAWRKRVLHLSGGNTPESGLIKNYTSALAGELENNRFGADVHTYYKTSNDPVQESAYAQILDLVDDGVALWLIFGHSSANIIDFDIGAPGVYHNQDRYPVMMVMGCSAGLCSANNVGLGESYLLAPNKGAIAYIATNHYGFIDALYQFEQSFYRNLGGAHYGSTIGQIMSATIDSLENTNSQSLMALLHQHILQGDPALRLYAGAGPDFTVDQSSASVLPNPVGLEQDSFSFRFNIANLGENTGVGLPIRIEQRLPDNTMRLLSADTVASPGFSGTYVYNFPTAGSQVGFNRIFLSLDPDNAVQESPLAAEANNTLLDAAGLPGIDVYFFDNDVKPVWPPDFGIEGGPVVKLYASTLNLGQQVKRYLFELDTSAAFDSPALKKTQIEQAGGILVWQAPVNWTDSTVYYWRVARDSLTDSLVLWRNASFLYLSGEGPGWNQSHFGQFSQDKRHNLLPDDTARQFEFSDNASTLYITLDWRGGGRKPAINNTLSEGYATSWQFDTATIARGVIFMVIEPKTGHFWRNPVGGPYHPGGAISTKYFGFNTADSLDRIRMMQFLENYLPDGYPTAMLAFNRIDNADHIEYDPRAWGADSVTYGKNLFQVLESLGAKEVRNLVNYALEPWPYAFIFNKNSNLFPPQDTTLYATAKDSVIQLRGDFLTKWSEGQLLSGLIGPALGWGSLHWERAGVDNSSDQGILELYGVVAPDQDTLLYRFTEGLDFSLDNIAPTAFPYLRVKYLAIDTLLRTVTQPEVFRISYQPFPEGAVNPAAGFTFYADTLQQGDMLQVTVPFENISHSPMDSLLVRFQIESFGTAGSINSTRFGALPVADTLPVVWSLSTAGLSGPQRLTVDVNPDKDQPELYHFNNVLVRDFYVAKDNRNPLLDVTFDGMHILDGDLVSPMPEIVFTMKDDNPFLAMRDTGSFRLTLETPDGVLLPVSFQDPAVVFIPADPAALPSKNEARLEWRPAFTVDGLYTLRVNGRDAAGNHSALLDYQVKFEVILRNALSNILNYPNPFSTSTCFVYTMSGAVPPADLRIQIMTVSGRVVREISSAEFGPLHTGTHLSDFCWDGRDQFGDQLANGVYLYRVTAKKQDGTPYEFFDKNAVDGFFKNGIGKMVLMR